MTYNMKRYEKMIDERTNTRYLLGSKVNNLEKLIIEMAKKGMSTVELEREMWEETHQYLLTTEKTQHSKHILNYVL